MLGARLLAPSPYSRPLLSVSRLAMQPAPPYMQTPHSLVEARAGCLALACSHRRLSRGLSSRRNGLLCNPRHRVIGNPPFRAPLRSARNRAPLCASLKGCKALRAVGIRFTWDFAHIISYPLRCKRAMALCAVTLSLSTPTKTCWVARKNAPHAESVLTGKTHKWYN